MATYTELHALRGSDTLTGLREKINVAIAIKALAIAKSASPSAGAKAWATQALGNPESYQPTVLNYILAEYNTVIPALITGATDAQVQIAVNLAVDTLLGV